MTTGGPSTIVTVLSVGGSCTFPLLSIARLLIVTRPRGLGVQEKLQVTSPRPSMAIFQVAPPSNDTSTLATTPPVSLAVPFMMAKGASGTVEPSAGNEIV